MSTKYPAQIDTSITLPKAIDNLTPVQGKVFNDLRDTVLAIESELGAKPSETYGTVRARLDALSGGSVTISNLSEILSNGNVTGGHDIVLSSGDKITSSNGTVVINSNLEVDGKIITNLINSIGLILNQQISNPYLTTTNVGIVWVKNSSPTIPIFTDSLGVDHNLLSPATAPPSGSAGGDLGGVYPDPVVTGLQGISISNAAPTDDYILAYDASLNQWYPSPRVGITVNSFIVNPSIVEVSQNVSTPSFTATYSQSPATAILTDSFGSPSKNVISSPNSFTSNGTSFIRSVFGQTITFTISVTASAHSASKTVNITWGQRNYFGVGIAGQTGGSFIISLTATGATTARTGTFIYSASPSQKVYYATRTAYGTPTFKDNSTGFAVDIAKTGDFSVTNAFGFTENYQLWESTNLGLGSLTMVVT